MSSLSPFGNSVDEFGILFLLGTRRQGFPFGGSGVCFTREARGRACWKTAISHCQASCAAVYQQSRFEKEEKGEEFTGVGQGMK